MPPSRLPFRLATPRAVAHHSRRPFGDARRPIARALTLGALAAFPAAGCRSAARVAPLPPPPLTADSATSTTVAPGVVHRAYWIARGPWAVHVLDVDRRACWTLEARKAGGAAVGRAGTLALVRGLADSAGAPVAGGVNADFFAFTPPGVPVSAHVERGRVIAGPGPRPVVAIDSAGAPWLGVLRASGVVAVGRDTVPLAAWNRGASDGVALFDAGWGVRTDSAPGRLIVSLDSVASARGRRTLVVRAIADGAASAPLAPGRAALVVGPRASAAVRARLAAWAPGTRADVTLALADAHRVTSASADRAPVRVREAVGGHPRLLADGAIVADVDSVGQQSFRDRNPRTAVGVSADGRRVWLVTVDGRQPGYSAGMTLRELAELFVSLGARNAVNLDGGGSTTFVVRGADGTYAIANRPSDAAGERPVANALAVVRRGCR